jgi:hypothetical protein
MSWRVDGVRALGALACAYFVVGGLASIVGLVGVIKRRQSNVRLFRDYSIADLAFAFTATTLFAFASTQSAVRTSLCEELSRQPELLRNVSDHAGLNVENCEGFLDKTVVGVVMVMFVVLFLRLQFTLTVLNYYAHLRRSEPIQNVLLPLSHRHTPTQSSSQQPQRILLLTKPVSLSPSPSSEGKASENTGDDLTWVYSRMQVSKATAAKMNAREAYLSVPLGSSSPRRADRSFSPLPRKGSIRLPAVEGEAPWTKGGHVRRMTMDEYEKFMDK